MLKRKQSVLPTTGNYDNQTNNILHPIVHTSASTVRNMGRKKSFKLIALIAVMNCVYTMHSDTSTPLLRRATSTTTNAFKSDHGKNNNLPLELIQAVQQAALKDHLVSTGQLESDLLVKADDIPLKNTGVGDTEAFVLGAWRENDGTNNDKEDEAQKKALIRNMKEFAKLSKEDKEDLAKNGKKDQTLMSQIFGTKSKNKKDTDNKEEEEEEEEDKRSLLFQGKNTKPDMEDMEAQAEAAKLKMRTLDATTIQNMSLDEINKLVEELGINPDVLPQNFAQAGSAAELAAVNKMGKGKGKGNGAMAPPEPNRSYMAMPTPEEVLKRAKADKGMNMPNAQMKDLKEMGASLLDVPFVGNDFTDHNPANHNPTSSLAARDQSSSSQAQNTDLAMLLQHYSAEDLAAALAQIQNGEGPIDPNSSLAAQPLPPQMQNKIPVQEEVNLPPPGCTRAPRIPAPKQEQLRPTMIASYPGSGARLSWKLIRAITGYMTSDDAVDMDDLSKKGLVIAIKSHYPAHGSTDTIFKPFKKVDTSVLLIRNPLKSIPSFLSYLYEREHNLENHSTRVPLHEWIKWRDTHFEKELMSWIQHTLFWMEHNTKDNTLVISYEKLVNEKTGPAEYAKLGAFLQLISGKELAQVPGDIPCVWDYIVNNRGDTSVNGKLPQSLRKGPKKYPFTDEQIDTVVHYLESLGQLYPEELGEIMEEYGTAALSLKEW